MVSCTSKADLQGELDCVDVVAVQAPLTESHDARAHQFSELVSPLQLLSQHQDLLKNVPLVMLILPV
jgi:hypothetical protein